MGNFPSKFGHASPLGSRRTDRQTDGRTEGQTDGQKQRLLPSFLRAGHNNNYEVGTLTVDGWAVTFGTARR